MRKGVCVHFNYGLEMIRDERPPVCKAGINFYEANGGRPGWFPVRPCLASNPALCPRYVEPTAEAIAEWEAEREEMFAAALSRLQLVAPLVSALRKDYPDGGGGQAVCPVCAGNLNWSIAESNGHMAMQCETQTCVNFIE